MFETMIFKKVHAPKPCVLTGTDPYALNVSYKTDKLIGVHIVLFTP